MVMFRKRLASLVIASQFATLVIAWQFATVGVCADGAEPRVRLQVRSTFAAPGDVVSVSVYGASDEAIAGFSFALSHDPRYLRLDRVDPSPELARHGTEFVFRRVENELEPPFGAILVVLDGPPPLGDVPALETGDGFPLATFTYSVSEDTPLDRVLSLDLAHRRFGTPPIAAEFVLPDLTTILPELCGGEIRVSDEPVFVRGDCNRDDGVDVSDAMTLLRTLFEGELAPGCLDACDSNDDGFLDTSDAVRLLLFLFAEGAPLPLPYPFVGLDLTDDNLSCADGRRV